MSAPGQDRAAASKPMASVPRDLLLEVLETAEGDSAAAENEYACNAQDRALYAAERAKIGELRRYAEDAR